jgi:hypothetical protein
MRYYTITLFFDKIDNTTDGIYPESSTPRRSLSDAINKDIGRSGSITSSEYKTTDDSIRVYKQTGGIFLSDFSHHYSIIVREDNMLFNLVNFYRKFGETMQSEDELNAALLDNTFLPDYIKSITGITQL